MTEKKRCKYWGQALLKNELAWFRTNEGVDKLINIQFMQNKYIYILVLTDYIDNPHYQLQVI